MTIRRFFGKSYKAHDRAYSSADCGPEGCSVTTSGRSADCGSTACTDKTAPNLGISQALRVAFDGLVKSVREEPILQGMTDLSTTVMCHFYNQACTAIV